MKRSGKQESGGIVHDEKRLFVIGEQQSAAEIPSLFKDNGHQSNVVFLRGNLPVQIAQLHPNVVALVFLDDLPAEALSLLTDLQSRRQIRIICAVSGSPTEPPAQALVLSAADFIRMPIDASELQLRVQRLVQLPPPAVEPRPITTGSRMPTQSPPAKTRHRRRKTRLTETEAQIVAVLEENVGTIVELATLCDLVGGGSPEQRINSVRVHILRLRHKVEPDPRRPQYILAVRAQGYVLTEPITHRLPQ